MAEFPESQGLSPGVSPALVEPVAVRVLQARRLVVSPAMPARPLVLAHRGASRRAPENTIEAFRLARELGADGVELDVRRTSDGVLVLSHDPVIEGFGLVVEHPFEHLRAERPLVPTLEEAFDALGGM